MATGFIGGIFGAPPYLERIAGLVQSTDQIVGDHRHSTDVRVVQARPVSLGHRSHLIAVLAHVPLHRLDTVPHLDDLRALDPDGFDTTQQINESIRGQRIGEIPGRQPIAPAVHRRLVCRGRLLE